MKLPRSLRAYWDAGSEATVEARTVSDAINALSRQHPGLTQRIVDDQGRLREFVHVFVNQDAVTKSELNRALKTGDVIHVLPSVAGGN